VTESYRRSTDLVTAAARWVTIGWVLRGSRATTTGSEVVACTLSRGRVWRGQGRRGCVWHELGRRGHMWHSVRLRSTWRRIVGLDEKRESKSSGGVPEQAEGKDDSSKTTCWETNRRFVVRLRHRCPLCSEEYQWKTSTGARDKLMGSNGRGVWVAGAPEDP
jgi:hypothetical protein